MNAKSVTATLVLVLAMGLMHVSSYPTDGQLEEKPTAEAVIAPEGENKAVNNDNFGAIFVYL